MIVTRNERYTDWLFQGAHMHEEAATVGNGLLSGHIYFRYATDFLKEGERVLRSRSFIVLSDGSTYELGTGEVANKVTVIDHGVTSGGELHLEVRGVDGSGIGVHSITRDVTIEYDDGKVPVLDEDQLKGVIAELHDSLTDSMVGTAEAVKTELREELNTIAIDVKRECAQATEAAKVELNARITSETAALNSSVSEVSTKVNAVGAELSSAKDELGNRISLLMETAPKICGWGHSGYFTARDDNWVNFIGGAAGDIGGNTEMISRSGNYFKVNGGAKPYDREFRVSVTGSITFVGAGDVSERVRFAARKKDNTTICQTGQYFVATGTTGDLTYNNVQFELTMRIHANDADNPLLTDGITVSFGRIGRQQVRLTNPGVTCVLTGTL